MKKTIVALTVIGILVLPLYAGAASADEDTSFLGQTSHFLEKVFSRKDSTSSVDDASPAPDVPAPPVDRAGNTAGSRGQNISNQQNVPDREQAMDRVKEVLGTSTENIVATTTEPERGRDRINNLKGENVPGIKKVGDKVRDFFNRAIDKATGTPQGPGDFRPADEANVPEEVRQFLEQRREEVRQKIREHREQIEEIREQVRQKIQEKRQEIEQRLQQIQNENRRQTAGRVFDNIYRTRERVLNNFDNTLNRIETVLANITTRANKASLESDDMSELETALNSAEEEVFQAREEIKNRLQEEYNIEIQNEENIRNEFQAVRNQLHEDLSGVRSMVQEAHQAARSAAELLNKAIESE